MDKYNTMEAIKAQAEYCRKEGLIFFAPAQFNRGRCYHCGINIYEQITKNGYTTGISVETAGSRLITACPHCHYSFVD